MRPAGTAPLWPEETIHVPIIELTDAQIEHLIREPKQLPRDYRTRLMNLRPRNAHQGSQLEISTQAGKNFEIFLRQGMNHLDFSVILGYHLPAMNRVFRLRRYNGKSHVHGNRIEGNQFYAFHIHSATARYQAIGAREDTYAEPTDRFASLSTAFDCMIMDCGFEGASLQLNLGLAVE